MEFMGIFIEVGKMKDKKPEDKAVQKQVEGLRTYITEHFCTCLMEILSGLGKMYAGGGSMTGSIDMAAGERWRNLLKE